MVSRTTARFRKTFSDLPPHVRESARRAYRTWQQDAHHRGLQFKCIHSTKPIYSVRVGLGWRAVGVRENENMIWFWIGSHADYERLIAHL